MAVRQALATGSLVLLLGAGVRAARRVGATGGRRSAVLGRLRSSPRRAVPWLSPPRWLPPALDDAAITLDPPVAWSLWIVSAVLAPGGALMVAGPAAALLAAVAAGLGPVVALRARRGAGDARVDDALPVALEAVARALRSGASLRQAVAEAAAATPGPLAGELAQVAAEAGHGRPLVDALDGLASRRPSVGVRLAVAALCLGIETGGAHAKAVDGVAATLRDRLAVTAEVRALSAQARISALVIGLAPLGFGVFATATDPRTAQFLLRTPPGWMLLGAGLTLDGVGWLWMRRLCRVTP